MAYNFETMTLLEGSAAVEALQEALRAMAHFGSQRDTMAIVAEMLAAAEVESARAFRDHEREQGEVP